MSWKERWVIERVAQADSATVMGKTHTLDLLLFTAKIARMFKWIIISRTKRWSVLGRESSPHDPASKTPAGSSVVIAMARTGNKDTEAFLILQRQKLNPSPVTQCLPFLSRDQINMGHAKSMVYFKGFWIELCRQRSIKPCFKLREDTLVFPFHVYL